jgi:hypothetical protein
MKTFHEFFFINNKNIYMNEYNDKWTREKFLEYRKLKKSGYSHQMLIEHFGEDIYYSGMYNKNDSSLPNILKYGKFINEIKIKPEIVDYSYIKSPSNFLKNLIDYIISFFSNNLPYIIALIYYSINDIITYNIVFTTRNQWNDYEFKLRNFLKKGYLTDEEFNMLNNIISKETNLNDLYSIFKKLSYILLNFYNEYLKDNLLSICNIDNKQKNKFISKYNKRFFH